MLNRIRLVDVTLWLTNTAAAAIFAVCVLSTVSLAIVVIVMSNSWGAEFGIRDIIHGYSRSFVLVWSTVAIAAGLSCAIFMWLVLRFTSAIIHSARSGDPFAQENSKRLFSIGWLLLALQGVAVLTEVGLRHWLPAQLQNSISFGTTISPVGIFASLLIFVLARIFRQGSDMRAELETTV